MLPPLINDRCTPVAKPSRNQLRDRNSLFETGPTEKMQLYKPGNQTQYVGAGETGPLWAKSLSQNPYPVKLKITGFRQDRPGFRTRLRRWPIRFFSRNGPLRNRSSALKTSTNHLAKTPDTSNTRWSGGLRRAADDPLPGFNPSEFWLPVRNPLHNRSRSPAVNRKPSKSTGYQRPGRSR